jgi:hypothetical protein
MLFVLSISLGLDVYRAWLNLVKNYILNEEAEEKEKEEQANNDPNWTR